MRALLVASLQPHAGRTAVVAALTRRLAYEGKRVLALRLGAAGDTAATADAEFLATLPGARGRGGSPVVPDDAGVVVPQLAGDGVSVVEAPDGAGVNALATALDAAVIVVHRGAADEDALAKLQDLALETGPRFLGVIVTAVPQGSMASVESAFEEAALPVLATLPEDRVLFSPTIAEIVDSLQAELLLGDEAEGQVIEELMIGPITTDPGQPYYARRGHKAVVTRSDKTDLQLAALASDTDCLILTGGVYPSPYTLDRASSEDVSVMLARTDTRATLDRLSGLFQSSRFSSERKLERMAELLQDRLDWPAVIGALS